MKKLKLGKIQKIPKGLKNLFIHWSRRKIIILLLVVLAGGAGYFFFHQRAGADTISMKDFSSSGPIEVQLPKNLADKAKQQGDSTKKFSDAENSAIDDLVKKEMDKKTPTVNSATTRQTSAPDSKKGNFQDAIVILKDENGKAILPDLEKLNSQSATSRAETGVPESNKINFIIGDGWTQEEKQKIQSVIDGISEDITKLREILGPPLFNIEVKIEKGQAEKAGNATGTYMPAINQIDMYILPDDYRFRDLLIHEINHAWRDDLLVWHNLELEESQAQFGRYYIRDRAGFIDDINTYPTNSLAITDMYNGLNRMFMYEEGYKSLVKILIEDNQAIKKFHNNLFIAKSNESSIVKNALVKSLPKSIEGEPAEKWLNRQYYLFPNIQLFPNTQAGAHFVTFPKDAQRGQYTIEYYHSIADSDPRAGTIRINDKFSYVLLPSDLKASVSVYDFKNKQVFSGMATGKLSDYVYFVVNTNGKDFYLSMQFDTTSVPGFQNFIDKYSGWAKFVIKNPQNNISTDFITYIFPKEKPANTIILFTTSEVKLSPNAWGLVTSQNMNNTIARLPFQWISDVAPNSPNGVGGLLKDVAYYHNGYEAKVVLSQICPIYDNKPEVSYFDEHGKLSGGIMVGSVNISRSAGGNLYINPTDELKNNTKPSITIKSSGLQKWTVATNKKSAITATITNNKNQTIKTIADKQIVDSQLPIVWDGKDNSGKPMPKGAYTLNVSATDKLCLTGSNKTPFQLTATTTDTRTDAQKRDDQRKSDLANLKSAIDEFSKKTSDSKPIGFPVSDGWIAAKDLPNSNDALAETLLPTKVMTNIPCDPSNTVKDCASGITYQYWRHDYSGIGGTDKEYSLYAKLESPTDADKATMNTGNAKMNTKAKEYGMNYRVGN